MDKSCWVFLTNGKHHPLGPAIWKTNFNTWDEQLGRVLMDKRELVRSFRMVPGVPKERRLVL